MTNEEIIQLAEYALYDQGESSTNSVTELNAEQVSAISAAIRLDRIMEKSKKSVARYEDDCCSLCGYNRPVRDVLEDISLVYVQYCYHSGSKIQFGM